MTTFLMRRLMLVAVLLSLLPHAVPQMAFPHKPVSLVVPYGPGGASDLLARNLAGQLSKSWGVPVVVVNRTGGSGTIATLDVIRAAADGHTVLLHLTGIVQNLSLYKQLPYDPFKDVVPVTQIGAQPMGLAVSAKSPHKTLASLLLALRSEPGKGAYGSFGTGSSAHIYGELLRSLADLRLPHVAYRGEAPMLPDIVSGRLDLGFVSAATAVEQSAGNRLRILAVTGAARLTALPEVPTMAEAGFQGFDLVGWFGLFVPKGTPASTVERISADTRSALSQPEMLQRMQQLSIEPIGNSPAQFDAVMRDDYRRWDALIRRFAIRIE